MAIDATSTYSTSSTQHNEWVSVQRAKRLFRYLEADDHQQHSFSKESAELNDALAPHLQLLLLRYNADNAFVSVFDRSYLYILAEAAGADTVPLAPEITCHGFPMIGRLCTYTLEQSPNSDSPHPIFHVADLSNDSRFKDYPFVANPDGASLRFYSGISLVPPDQGDVSIGTVAVMGRQIKHSLSLEEKNSLKTTARTIMNFLNMKRDAADSVRSKRLTSCLSDFVFHPKTTETSPTHKDTSSHITEGLDGISEQSAATVPYESRNSKEVTIFSRALNSINKAFDLEGNGEIMFLNAKSACRPNESFKDHKALQSMDGSIGQSSSFGRVIVCSNGIQRLLTADGEHYSSKMEALELLNLADHYPRGKLWQFDVHGYLPAESVENTKPQSDATLPDTSLQHGETQLLDIIQTMSPTTRQVFMVPMLDSSIGQWRSICLVWCTNATRLFSQVDLGILMTYAQAIMTDCSLREVMQTNLRKADFIGSISHELRTPLHGILAATELLEQEDGLTPFQKSMVQTARSCGDTLLDTISHVLEYSKINTFERKNPSSQKALNDHKINGHSDSSQRVSDTSPDQTPEKNDLVQSLEHAIDVVLQSHRYNQEVLNEVGSLAIVSQFQSDESTEGSQESEKLSTLHKLTEVGVLLNIEPGSWDFPIPSGAFKRLIMNLVGNSLKYTESGQVLVEMSTSETTAGNEEQAIIELKVTDTGRGISAEYLEKRLFIPFAQEDPLFTGVGLGLSICKSIVSQLGGTLAIESALGVGTTVKVLIPSLRSSGGHPVGGVFNIDDSKFKGHIVSYLNLPDINGKEVKNSHETFQTLTKSCTKWFAIELVHHDLLRQADIVISQPKTLVELSEAQRDQLRKSKGLIVICETAQQQISVDDMLRRWSFRNTVSITTPCGPNKLRKAFMLCLGARPSSNGNQPVSASDLLLSKQSAIEKVHPISNSHSTVARKTNGIALSHGPRLLLVDDNQINLRLLQSFCKKQPGAMTEVATDGKMALNAVMQASHAERFDIIFMDISMPIMDGIAATRAIRQYEQQESMRPAQIIAVTGLVNERDRDNALQAGVDTYLTKPLRLKQISSILENWVSSQSNKASE